MKNYGGFEQRSDEERIFRSKRSSSELAGPAPAFSYTYFASKYKKVALWIHEKMCPVNINSPAYQELSRGEGDNESSHQVEANADKEVGEVRQEDPMKIAVQHDVGPVQVHVFLPANTCCTI